MPGEYPPGRDDDPEIGLLAVLAGSVIVALFGFALSWLGVVLAGVLLP